MLSPTPRTSIRTNTGSAAQRNWSRLVPSRTQVPAADSVRQSSDVYTRLMACPNPSGVWMDMQGDSKSQGPFKLAFGSATGAARALRGLGRHKAWSTSRSAARRPPSPAQRLMGKITQPPPTTAPITWSSSVVYMRTYASFAVGNTHPSTGGALSTSPWPQLAVGRAAAQRPAEQPFALGKRGPCVGYTHQRPHELK